MTYTPIRDRQWPPKPKTPVEIGKSVWDDLNEFSRWSIFILGGRNPFAAYGYMAASMYGIGFAGTWLAGASTATSHQAGRIALTQFVRASVGMLGTATGAGVAAVAATYYVGRNVAHAIDPEKGEARFHYALINPGAAFTETQYNFTSYYLDRRLGEYQAARSGGGGGGF